METPETSARPQRDFSLLLIAAFAFLVPILVLPFGGFPFQFSKTALAVLIVLALVALLAVRVLRKGSVHLVWSSLIGATLFLPFAYLVAALFSSHPSLSFFGYQLETDTFGFMLFAAATVCGVALAVMQRTKVFSVLVALFFGAWVVFLFQLLQVLFQAPLPISALGDPSVNMIGRWNDFGLFAGLAAALSLLTLETLPLLKRHRFMLLATLAVSVFFAALVNSTTVWALVGGTGFVLLLYALAYRQFLHKGEEPAQKTSGVVSGVVLAIALFFALFGGSAAGALQSVFNINTFEVRPSLRGTVSVVSGVFEKSPLVGSGPNTFSQEWLLYRPSAVLGTPFWNVSFNSGSGFVPTVFASGGILVALAWLLFLGALLFTMLRALLMTPQSGDRAYFLTSITALGALYLALAHIFYAPSQSLTLLFFLFVGLFLATLKGTKLLRSVDLSVSGMPRIGFVAVLASVALLVVSAISLYGVGISYASAVQHQKALARSNAGDLDSAFTAVQQAIALSPQDRYYRTATLIDLARLNQIVNSNADDSGVQEAFRAALTRAIQNAGAAIERDPLRFDNWFLRSTVYASVVPLGIDGAAENALSTLEEAQRLNPRGPEVDLRRANVYAAQGNTEEARAAITSALEKKADYTDAILLLAQIELDEGNLTEAINSVAAAVYFEPENPVLLYQLGILLLEDESYEDAATAFETALSVQPEFANAAFFLAQAYAFLDQTDDAADIMERLAGQNPDNDLVAEYLAALESGENPFEETTPPPEEVSEGLEEALE